MTMFIKIIMKMIILVIIIKTPTSPVVIQKDIFDNTKIFSTKFYYKVEAVFK